ERHATRTTHTSNRTRAQHVVQCTRNIWSSAEQAPDRPRRRFGWVNTARLVGSILSPRRNSISSRTTGQADGGPPRPAETCSPPPSTVNQGGFDALFNWWCPRLHPERLFRARPARDHTGSAIVPVLVQPSRPYAHQHLGERRCLGVRLPRRRGRPGRFRWERFATDLSVRGSRELPESADCHQP